MGRVRAGFLYARPTGPYPLLEPNLFNKQFFFLHPNPPCGCGPHPVMLDPGTPFPNNNKYQKISLVITFQNNTEN